MSLHGTAGEATGAGTLAGVWFVCVKESMDNLRDRRSLFLALIYPVLGALLLGLLVSFVGGMFRGQDVGRLQLAVQNAWLAPELVRYLADNEVDVIGAPANPHRAVRRGALDAVLVIPDSYGDDLRAQRTARLDVVVNATRLSTVITVARVVELLRAYDRELADARLKDYGVPPEAAAPLKIQSVNVGRSRNLAGFFLNMLPPFIIFTIFVGGVYMAIDTTAGERERGSMEPLLTNPIGRWQLMLGKAMATMLFTATAVIVQLCAFKLMFELVSSRETGMQINPDGSAFVMVFLLSLPLMAFAVALQVIVATVSRSTKETQTYLGLLPLIPSLPGMILVFVPLKAQLWMLTVPTFGQILLIGKFMREEPVALSEIAVSAGATGLAAALLLFVAARLYERDQLVFGG